MSKQVNYNENLVAGAAIRDDKGRRISKLFESPHPKMTVGYAKNLIMPDDPTEQEFNFRQSGGGVIEDGVAVIDKVKGNSVVWNQLIGTHNTAELNSTVAGVTISTNTDERVREYTLNGTATEDPIFAPIAIHQANKLSVINGHKYLIFSVSTSGAFCQWKRHEDDADLLRGNGANIIVATTNGTIRFNIRCSAGTEFKNEKYIPRIIDLTQMFGAGNEPSTVEEFLQRKPFVEDEYAYNEGTIVNNKVEKVKATGVNLWDESKRVNGKYIDYLTGKEISNAAYSHTGYVRVLPNTEYYFKQGIDEPQYGAYYDADKNFILGSSGFKGMFTTPAQAAYVRITLGAADSSDNICINLSDPAINGQYFPYEEHTLDLSWVKDIKDAEGVKLFEDGMRSAGTAFDEVEKNKAIKRFGVKVFDGTESFTDYLVDYGSFAIMRDAFVGVGSSIGISNRYVVSGLWESDPDRTKYDKQIYIDSINNRVWIRDSAFADVDSLKQYLAELYAAGTPLVLYYELAEPIEVEYDEKSLTYPVVAGGTEEAIASEPSSAFRADIGYGIDAVKTILDLKARVEALEGK